MSLETTEMTTCRSLGLITLKTYKHHFSTTVQIPQVCFSSYEIYWLLLRHKYVLTIIKQLIFGQFIAPLPVLNNVGMLVCLIKKTKQKQGAECYEKAESLLCCSFCVYVPPPWTCLQNGLCSSGSEKTLLSLLVIWARYSWPEERTRKGGR